MNTLRSHTAQLVKALRFAAISDSDSRFTQALDLASVLRVPDVCDALESGIADQFPASVDYFIEAWLKTLLPGERFDAASRVSKLYALSLAHRSKATDRDYISLLASSAGVLDAVAAGVTSHDGAVTCPCATFDEAFIYRLAVVMREQLKPVEIELRAGARALAEI